MSNKTDIKLLTYIMTYGSEGVTISRLRSNIIYCTDSILGFKIFDIIDIKSPIKLFEDNSAGTNY